MKLDFLKTYIEGCKLKQECLEAFLLQGAYIEGIIKQLVDLWVFVQMSFSDKNKSDDYKKLENAISKRINTYGLFDLIEFLFDMGKITDSERRKLHKYRESRNEVVHSLLTKIKKESFQDELKASLQLGDEIMSSPQFKSLEELIIRFEKEEEEIKAKKENNTVDR